MWVGGRKGGGGWWDRGGDVGGGHLAAGEGDAVRDVVRGVVRDATGRDKDAAGGVTRTWL
jgi:hypothetical protein